MIFSSTVFSVIIQYTLTHLVYPIQWALSIAYKSTYGFQSLSNNITVSAVVKLIPSPPAQVLNRKMNFLLFLAVNSSIYFSLSYKRVDPSIQQYSNSL